MGGGGGGVHKGKENWMCYSVEYFDEGDTTLHPFNIELFLLIDYNLI